jgi:hypothetical protein
MLYQVKLDEVVIKKFSEVCLWVKDSFAEPEPQESSIFVLL